MMVRGGRVGRADGGGLGGVERLNAGEEWRLVYDD